VTHLQAQNDVFRAENDKIKQHYKELYDSIKITHVKHIEQVTKVTTENMNLKTGVSKATVNPLVSARDKHAIDVEPIVPRLRNNRNAHLDYLRHLKESVETIRDIVEEAKVIRPLDRSIVSVYRYTKHSQELLEYAIGTCPHGSQPRAKQLAYIPLIRKKQVIVAQPSNKVDSTTYPHVVTVTSQKTNVPVPPSTGVDCCPIACGSQPMSHVKPNRISPAKGDTKLPIDDKPRKNKSHLRTSTRIDSSSRLKRTVINSHSNSVCQTCAKCVTPSNHNLCVATCLQSAMATPPLIITVVLSKNEEESEKVMLGVEKGSQDEGQAESNPDETSEGQAGSNPDETSEGQAGPDPGNAEARVQSTSSPVVHAGSDREHMDIDVANVSLQPSTEQLYEGDFTFGDQFFSDKPSDADKSTETEVESMVNVPIQQAMSSISLMTS
nr:hypothetical protein [Tanacetum cinerariifolium]